MKIQSIFLDKQICNNIVKIASSLKDTQNLKNQSMDLVSLKEKKYPLDDRELIIFDKYKNNQELDYFNIVSNSISEIIPLTIFNYFGLIREKCKIDVKIYTPGKIHFPHKDYYLKYKTINNIQNSNITRLWVSLTEPKFGHILLLEDKSFYNLRQGSIITWNSSVLHAAANLGFEDRYIMTITGISSL